MSEQAAENLKAQLERELAAVREDGEAYRVELEETAARSRASRRLRDGSAADAGDQAAGSDPGAAAMTVLADRTLPPRQRIELLERLGAPFSRSGDHIEALLRIVRDTRDDADVRAVALRVLGGAAFQVARFQRWRSDYVAALRDLLDDPVPALRQTAATTLAQEHDPVVQQLLADGLRGEGPLPVPREYAIRLLAEDDHLDNLPWLRELFAGGSAEDRQEAVRFMASYPAAADELERVMRDRTENADVRAAGSVSLRQLAPERFGAAAKEIATDPAEDVAVRTASLSGLQLTAAEGGVHDDAGFVDAVRAVGADESAPGVAQAARDLLAQGEPAPEEGPGG